jgi:pimeloyl-ACP methyl ester carboxylesterase
MPFALDPPFDIPLTRATRVTTNGITLSVLESGPEDGPLVVLLHGFPELSFGWRHQIPALAAAGYRVVAPDQRGYATSDKPKGPRAYHLDELAGDITGLIDHYGREKAFVVGHDWGAVVAWWLGTNHPERVQKLVCMNVPHPSVMKKALSSSFAQLKKSWYVFFFQLPVLPERAIAKGGAGILKRTSNRGSFIDDELPVYRHAWRIAGAATGMLNWYRAMRYMPTPKTERVVVPTLLIWGKKDHALGHEMAAPSIAHCDDGRLEMIDDATHWVQHDARDRVNALLVEFLR